MGSGLRFATWLLVVVHWPLVEGVSYLPRTWRPAAGNEVGAAVCHQEIRRSCAGLLRNFDLVDAPGSLNSSVRCWLERRLVEYNPSSDGGCAERNSLREALPMRLTADLPSADQLRGSVCAEVSRSQSTADGFAQ